MDVEKRKFGEKNLRVNLCQFKFMKKWSSGLRRQTVNLLGIPVVGSNPTFFFNFCLFFKAKYNAEVACLFWEQEVMCSNHIISKIDKTFLEELN